MTTRKQSLQNFPKINISNLLISRLLHSYQGVKNVTLWEILHALFSGNLVLRYAFYVTTNDFCNNKLKNYMNYVREQKVYCIVFLLHKKM